MYMYLGKKTPSWKQNPYHFNQYYNIIMILFFSPKTADRRQKLRRRFSSSFSISFVSVGSEGVGNVSVKVTLPWPPGVELPERAVGDAEQQQSRPQQEQQHSQQHSHYHTRPLPAWGVPHYIIITSSRHHHYIIGH